MVTSFNELGETSTISSGDRCPSPVISSPPAKISQAVIIKCAKISQSNGQNGEIQSPGSAGSSATSPTSPSGPAPASLTRSPVERYLKAPAPGGKSLLPKPEISPKPSHLRGVTSNGVVNHLMTGSLQMQNGNGNASNGPTDIDAFAASVASVANIVTANGAAAAAAGNRPQYATSPPGAAPVGSGGAGARSKRNSEGEESLQHVPSTKTLTEKTKGTASILKSTLKRMTKLSLRTGSSSSSSSSSHGGHHSNGSNSAHHQNSPPDGDTGSQHHDTNQHHHSPVRRSMSPFRSMKKNSPNGVDPNGHGHHGSTNGAGSSGIPSSGYGSLIRPKSSSLRKNNSNSDILSSSHHGHGNGGGPGSYASLKKTGSVSQNSLNRSGSCGTGSRQQRIKQACSASDASNFKVPSENSNAANVRSLSRSSSASSTNNMGRSHSLKRAGRNKDNAQQLQQQSDQRSLQRTGSGSGLNRQDVKRSNSMHQSYHGGHGGGHGNRRFRDRDLNVKLSRGIQTSLTKDAMTEDADDAEDRVVTDVNFSLYMPDVLGGDTGANDVETHVTEPTEPVDVRRNRQLTLDNMKLHREIEKLKTAANESDHLKRELRTVRSRLEDEQRARQRIEHELDQHNEKVKLIARSMDSVEQEFEVRDANIRQLEVQIQKSRSAMATLEDKLRVANDVIARQNADLAEAVAARKAAVREYEVAESEANELHEFLQAEKFTLAEALREAETEIESLKSKVASSEEQCGHLVRLGEQRHQEILSLETQLKAMEDKAKEMLLAQGAEISRSTILIAELSWKIEDAFKANFPAAFEALEGSEAIAPPPLPASDPPAVVNGANGHLPESHLTVDHVSVDTTNGHSNDSKDDPSAIGSACDASLLSLSNAIQRRVSVEKSLREAVSISTSANGSTLKDPKSAASLVDRIAQVNRLVDFFSEASAKQQSQRPSASGDQNGHTNGQENGMKNIDQNEQKENISLNGNSDSLSSDSRKKYEEEIAEMKAKYLKHRQILVSNREQAEREVMRIDDIYHETVSDVLKAFASVPEVVKTHKELHNLQGKLQTALLMESNGDTPPSAATTSNGGKMKMNGIINGTSATTAIASSEQGL